MNVQLTNMQTRDVEALLHPYTNAAAHRQLGAHVIETGKGVYVYDEHGREFIEGMFSLYGVADDNDEPLELPLGAPHAAARRCALA